MICHLDKPSSQKIFDKHTSHRKYLQKSINRFWLGLKTTLFTDFKYRKSSFSICSIIINNFSLWNVIYVNILPKLGDFRWDILVRKHAYSQKIFDHKFRFAERKTFCLAFININLYLPVSPPTTMQQINDLPSSKPGFLWQNWIQLMDWTKANIYILCSMIRV